MIQIKRGVVALDKKILADYMDAMELIKETEDDIRKLKKRRKTVIQTNVKGSNLKFPYQEKHYRIEGTTFTYKDDKNLRLEEKLLEQRKANAENIKLQVEEWMLTLPSRMQRIVRYKIFEGSTWEEVAKRLGRKASGDSVRKEFENFFKN